MDLEGKPQTGRENLVKFYNKKNLFNLFKKIIEKLEAILQLFERTMLSSDRTTDVTKTLFIKRRMHRFDELYLHFGSIDELG